MCIRDSDEDRLHRLSGAAVARIRQQANVGLMGDAFFDESFCRALVQAIGSNLDLATANGKLHFKATAAYAALSVDVESLAVSRPSAMSSNTVVTRCV